ncbi:hypothetical protein HY497_02100 [Candidatus Woesearchaeota archaeon]|nr:hypothetical protein [Candidatus Woesearchaeota archaeon]
MVSIRYRKEVIVLALVLIAAALAFGCSAQLKSEKSEKNGDVSRLDRAALEARANEIRAQLYSKNDTVYANEGDIDRATPKTSTGNSSAALLHIPARNLLTSLLAGWLQSSPI